MLKKIIYILFLLLIISSFIIYKNINNFKQIFFSEKKIVVFEKKNIKIKVEIADEALEQWQGLSDRKKLNKNNGMLFIFTDKKIRTFVMRRMNFPLDIIFINDDKIINIQKNLKPEGKITINKYSSLEPVNYVLEVNAGFTDKYKIKAGDKIKLK